MLISCIENGCRKVSYDDRTIMEQKFPELPACSEEAGRLLLLFICVKQIFRLFNLPLSLQLSPNSWNIINIPPSAFPRSSSLPFSSPYFVSLFLSPVAVATPFPVILSLSHLWIFNKSNPTTLPRDLLSFFPLHPFLLFILFSPSSDFPVLSSSTLFLCLLFLYRALLLLQCFPSIMSLCHVSSSFPEPFPHHHLIPPPLLCLIYVPMSPPLPPSLLSPLHPFPSPPSAFFSLCKSTCLPPSSLQLIPLLFLSPLIWLLSGVYITYLTEIQYLPSFSLLFLFLSFHPPPWSIINASSVLNFFSPCFLLPPPLVSFTH